MNSKECSVTVNLTVREYSLICFSAASTCAGSGSLLLAVFVISNPICGAVNHNLNQMVHPHSGPERRKLQANVPLEFERAKRQRCRLRVYVDEEFGSTGAAAGAAGVAVAPTVISAAAAPGTAGAATGYNVAKKIDAKEESTVNLVHEIGGALQMDRGLMH